MNIYCRTIPHETQRYPTVGDWYFDNEENPTTLFIFVSDMGNHLFEYLVQQHEQIEAMQCLVRGIKEKDVSAFDIDFEHFRAEGDLSEPGDSPDAPYYREHQLATKLEKELAEALGIDWKEYEDAVNSL